jgi:hypothetical protein
MSPVAADDCRARAITIGWLIVAKNPIKVAAFPLMRQIAAKSRRNDGCERRSHE